MQENDTITSQEEASNNKRISYTQIKTYVDCPFRFKLLYLDKLEKSEDNDIFAYGRAVHVGVQKLWESDCNEAQQVYLQQLRTDFAKLGKSTKDVEDKGLQLIFEMYKTGYPEFKCLGIEELLEEPFYNDCHFKGLIDLVLEVPEDPNNPSGKKRIKLIDFKTTEKGWGWYKKHDFMTLMQLLLYKWFYSEKHNVPLSQIDLEFILLNGISRTVEFFAIEHKDADVKKAWDIAVKVINYIYNKNEFKKNIKSCEYCQFKDRPEICDRQTDLLIIPDAKELKNKQKAFYNKKNVLDKKLNTK